MSEANDTIDIIVYSDDYTVRQQVIEAVGRRAAKGQPAINWAEAATGEGLVLKVRDGNFPIVIVDSEATKVSGLVAAKTITAEIEPVPLMIAILGRPQDEWLSEFSGVTMNVAHPIDPIDMQETVAAAIEQVR